MKEENPQPSFGVLLRAWFLLGLQSFGGGTATLALIRQTVVERYDWVPEAEFTRDWTLVQAAPGINLLAFTILIGKRLGGWRGIVACMAGLLLPSVTVTILLTAGYAQIQRLPLVQAALRGVLPATVGMGVITAYQMARPPLVDARREGTPAFIAYLILLFACVLAALRWRSSVILILAAAGVLGAMWHGLHERFRAARVAEKPSSLSGDAASATASAPSGKGDAP